MGRHEWRRLGGRVASAALGAAVLAAGGGARAEDALAQVRSTVAAATASSAPWTGPTSGPKAVAGRTIVYVAGDLRNGGIQGVADGVKEAGARIGWTVRVLDGQGSVSGIQSAFGQAVALRPDGIVVGGYDAVQNAASLAQAAAAGIRLVACTAARRPARWRPSTSPTT